MKKIIVIICYLLLLSSSKILACDCGYLGPFVEMAKKTKLVALIRVTKYLTFKDFNVEKRIPMSMEVEIINVYKGKEHRKKVVVWGDIGNFCRPFLSKFNHEEYYVIAFSAGNQYGGHPKEKDSDYSICSCGAYWLNVDNQNKMAYGDIDSNDRTSSKLSLKELKFKLRQTTIYIE